MEHIQIRCNTTQVHNLQIQIVVLLRGNFAHPISCLENDPLHTVLRVGVARPVAPRAVVGLLALSPDEALLLLGTRPDRLHALSDRERDSQSATKHGGIFERSARFRTSATGERARVRASAQKSAPQEKRRDECDMAA